MWDTGGAASHAKKETLTRSMKVKLPDLLESGGQSISKSLKRKRKKVYSLSTKIVTTKTKMLNSKWKLPKNLKML